MVLALVPSSMVHLCRCEAPATILDHCLVTPMLRFVALGPGMDRMELIEGSRPKLLRGCPFVCFPNTQLGFSESGPRQKLYCYCLCPCIFPCLCHERACYWRATGLTDMGMGVHLLVVILISNWLCGQKFACLVDRLFETLSSSSLDNNLLCVSSD